MKNKRLILLALGVAVLALSMIAVLAVTPVASAKKGGKGKGKAKIVWSANPLRAEVAPGETYSATVSFTTNKDLANAHLNWTPSLSSTLTISPTDFVSITAGVPYSVQVTFIAPVSGTRAHYNGVAHLRKTRKNHPNNLKLRFSVPISPTGSAP